MQNIEIESKNTKKQFRLRGKKLLLTYELSNIEIIELKDIEKLIIKQLEKKVPKIIQYIITEKKYEDETIYYQIYLEFNQRIELYGLNCLNLEFNNIHYQGKYQTVRKKDIVIRSMIKTNNYIAKPKLYFLDGELYLNFKEFLTQLHKKNRLDEMKNYLNF